MQPYNGLMNYVFRFCYIQWNNIYCFTYSRISNSFDGSKDELFRGYEDIKKGNEIIKFNDDKLYWDSDYVTSSDSDEKSFLLKFS